MTNSYLYATPNTRMYTSLSAGDYAPTDKSLTFVITPCYEPNNILYVGKVYAPTWIIETSQILSNIHKQAELDPDFASVSTSAFSINTAYRIYRLTLYRGSVIPEHIITTTSVAYLNVRQLPFKDELEGFNPINIFPILNAERINPTIECDWYKSGTLYRRIDGKVDSAKIRATFYDGEDTEITSVETSVLLKRIVYEYSPTYTIAGVTTQECTTVYANYRLTSGYAMYLWANLNRSMDISQTSYVSFQVIINYTHDSTQETKTVDLGSVKINTYPNEERNDTWLLQWYDSNGQYCCLPCRGSNKWKSTASRNSYMKDLWETSNFNGDVSYELTINTGWVDEPLNRYLEGLFNSRNIWISNCSIFTNKSSQNIRPIKYSTQYSPTAGKYPSYTGIIQNPNNEESEVFACTVKSNYQEKTRKEDRQLINYTLNLQLNKKQIMN